MELDGFNREEKEGKKTKVEEGEGEQEKGKSFISTSQEIKDVLYPTKHPPPPYSSSLSLSDEHLHSLEERSFAVRLLALSSLRTKVRQIETLFARITQNRHANNSACMCRRRQVSVFH